MDEKDMAFEIVQAFMRMEAEIEARGVLLDRCWGSPDSPWDRLSHAHSSKLLNDPQHQKRLSEFQSASSAASDGDSLIRVLHQEILRRAQVS